MSEIVTSFMSLLLLLLRILNQNNGTFVRTSCKWQDNGEHVHCIFVSSEYANTVDERQNQELEFFIFGERLLDAIPISGAIFTGVKLAHVITSLPHILFHSNR